MKYLVYLLLLIALTAACTNSQKSNDQQMAAEPSPSEVQVLTVETLLAHPDDYNGKQVRVTGMVTHVCKHSGKRLHLLGADEKTRIRLEAGEIGQFDRSLEGSDILATGIFRKEVIDEEYLAKWSDELKKGDNHDHASGTEQEGEAGQIERYRSMMKENDKGYLENFWIDGIQFETIQEDVTP